MDIQKAKAHLAILKSAIMTAQDLNSAIKFFEKFIDEVKDHAVRSITWSVEDFEHRAKENEPHLESNECYDKTKFEDTLYRMILSHDANNGIAWDTVDFYLDEYCLKEKE